MHCTEFLYLYSDYRDGLITDLRVSRRVRDHLETCAACQRYDEVIRRGVAVLRGAEIGRPPLGIEREVSRPNGMGLVDETLELRSGRFAGAIMLAAAIALFVWEGLGTSPDGQISAPRVTQAAPHAVANPGPPFVHFVTRPTALPTTPPRVPPPPTSGDAATLTLYQPTPDR